MGWHKAKQEGGAAQLTVTREVWLCETGGCRRVAAQGPKAHNRRVDITALLQRAREGDDAARDRLYRLLYAALEDGAERAMGGQRRDHTLEPQALVHEAFLRLVGRGPFENRTHFLATAATAMRCVLVDHARARQRKKRGAGERPLSLDAVTVGCDKSEFDVLALHDALEKLAEFDPQAARVVELRFFAGLTVAEAADALGVSARRVERDWQGARAWLRGEMA